MTMPYNNCEEDICAYNLENFLDQRHENDMHDLNVKLQDSGQI